MTEAIEGDYDTIIVGAGSAGCLLANRLSEDRSRRVLLLEAGGDDNWLWYYVPVGYLYSIGNPRSDWMFKTEPEEGLNGRSLPFPRGKVIGGSSAINAMIYMRGQAADYDNWRNMGLPGWGWDDVLPYYKRHEDYFAGASATHATGGECRVEPQRVSWPLLDAFRQAAGQTGIPLRDDFNNGTNEGSSFYHVTQRRGVRWTSARGFLKPVLGRRNLRLETGCLVERIHVEQGRAAGVSWRQGGDVRRANSRGEVILAAGSIGSPHLMMASGIGPGAHLSEHGITTVHELPGVGQNLSDHLQVRLIHRITGARTLNTVYHSMLGRLGMVASYALLQRGPLTMAPAQLGLYARSDPSQPRANVQFHVQALSLDRWGAPLHDFPAFTTSVCNAHPTSRGWVKLAGPDISTPPRIKPNYLATEQDRRVLLDAVRLARHIVGQPALSRFSPQEILPGDPDGGSDAGLLKAAGDIATTIFHPVGTAKMGTTSDAGAVVDQRLRVRGITGLRVADASIMPTITSGNTAAPTMMIAEKAAAMIIEDERR